MVPLRYVHLVCFFFFLQNVEVIETCLCFVFLISFHLWLFLGQWASFGGAAGSVRLHNVRSREGDVSHGRQSARYDTAQGEMPPGAVWGLIHANMGVLTDDAMSILVHVFTKLWYGNGQLFVRQYLVFVSFAFIFVAQDQITEDVFTGEEKGVSPADYLTAPVTSNTSELLHHLQGNTVKRLQMFVPYSLFLRLLRRSCLWTAGVKTRTALFLLIKF